jgi:hypothetical protein
MGTVFKKELYYYAVDGIYFLYGPLEGKNITKLYMENPDGVEEFLEKIIESDLSPYRMKINTKLVLEDLKN